ncbi:uncharacterized protein E6C27_scaffold191G001270 [Cucumis melo var. makuwa]|uniref:Uncharacterized protein n=1 Tax=Cucumis melo var. makuwa TaxID=1194695 RepID=A0A5A7T133_CUCMM|nr:uncharacterized protein E6C27_scaffold191G001270 [Cucumis melo var. makuwa]
MLDRKPPQQVRPPPPLKMLCSFVVEDLVRPLLCSSAAEDVVFIRHNRLLHDASYRPSCSTNRLLHDPSCRPSCSSVAEVQPPPHQFDKSVSLAVVPNGNASVFGFFRNVSLKCRMIISQVGLKHGRLNIGEEDDGTIKCEYYVMEPCIGCGCSQFESDEVQMEL